MTAISELIQRVRSAMKPAEGLAVRTREILDTRTLVNFIEATSDLLTAIEAEPASIDAKAFAIELRKWWSFNNYQEHTHTWHTRENFIDEQLPKLLATRKATP